MLRSTLHPEKKGFIDRTRSIERLPVFELFNHIVIDPINCSIFSLNYRRFFKKFVLSIMLQRNQQKLQLILPTIANNSQYFTKKTSHFRSLTNSSFRWRKKNFTSCKFYLVCKKVWTKQRTLRQTFFSPIFQLFLCHKAKCCLTTTVKIQS